MNRKKERKPNPRIPIQGKLAELTEIPDETFSADSSVYVVATRKAEVSGCCGVLEYTTTCILFRTKNGTVTLNGEGLEICSLMKDQITVRGEIFSLHFNEKPGVER